MNDPLVCKLVRITLLTLILAAAGLVSASQTALAVAPTETLSGGGYHTCGLKSDGTLACWGSNTYGQADPPGGTFTQVSAAYAHTCAIKSDGTLACWGFNDDERAIPSGGLPSGAFTQVSAGDFHTCGLRGDGTVICWGRNDADQVTPPSETFTQISAGGQHNCGIKIDGTLACWGDNGSGQTDPPTTPPGATFTQIDAGVYHNCAVRDDGTVACWGDDGSGQATPPIGTFTQVSAGWYHTCGLRTDGALACWGSNGYGQAAPPGGTFTQVSAGDEHTCGMRSDGTLTCWGKNWYGQAPRIALSPAGLPAAGTGSAYIQAITASGGTSPYSYKLAGGSLPPGISLDAGGALSGSCDTSGEYTFTVQATDASSGLPFSGQKEYTLLVDTPPTGADGAVQTDEDTAYTFSAANFLFEDANGQAFGGIRVDSLPASGSLKCAGVNASAGTACTNVVQLAFTPAANDSGQPYASFTFAVLNALGAASSQSYNMTIDVTPVNDAPVLAALSDQRGDPGSSIRFTASASDVDPLDTLAFSLDAGAPAGAGIDPAGGIFTWTPSEAQGPGVYSVTVRVTDSGSPALDDFETIDIIIDELNQAPQLAAIADQQATAGQALELSGSLSDPNSGDSITLQIDWGDGAAQTIPLPAGTTTFDLSHVYAHPGDYTAALTVTDDDGATDTLTFDVEVQLAIRRVYLPAVVR